jgi:protease I
MAAALYPTLLPAREGQPYGLTVQHAASGEQALRTALFWWPIGIALALTYFAVLYRHTLRRPGLACRRSVRTAARRPARVDRPRERPTANGMANELQGQRIAILATDGVERVELEQPRQSLEDAGAATQLLSIHTGEIQARKHDLDPAGTFTVDGLVADASVDDYDALVLPGGTVNPDKLRMDSQAVSFVRDFVGTGKPVAAICHGPWTLVEADVVRGRTMTSWPSVRTDLRNAGANVVDQEAVVDGKLVTSRSPDDLPAFCSTIIQEFAASHARA